jgi:hypothetical protein
MRIAYDTYQINDADDPEYPPPFDRKLEIWKGYIPLEVARSMVFTCDPLELCYAIGCQVFGLDVMPEQVFQIYDRVVAHLNNNHSSLSVYVHKQKIEDETS